jgi:hypothetical protein
MAAKTRFFRTLFHSVKQGRNTSQGVSRCGKYQNSSSVQQYGAAEQKAFISLIAMDFPKSGIYLRLPTLPRFHKFLIPFSTSVAAAISKR